MITTTTRHTADERRDEIIEAAMASFADTGLEGTSTETIAQAVGISQPYLFRLFGTKKHLFIAAVERCFDETLDGFREAAHGAPPEIAGARIGDAYFDMLRDRPKLRMQMQAYAACDDAEIRSAVQGGFARLAAYIAEATGFTSHQLALFLAQGMLLNVLASMDVLDSDEPWAVAVREGCMAVSS